MKTKLSIEESARLVELGVDPKLASGESLVGGAVFTLTNILSVLPKGIIHEGLSCKFRITSWYDEPYFAGYEKQVDGYVCIFDVPELIDALNSLLIWCLTEKKINLNTEKK